MNPAAAVLDTVFPPLCPITGDPVVAGGGVSAAAWRDLVLLAAPGCTRCGRSLPGPLPAEEDPLICESCHRHPPGWDRGAAAFAYEGTGRALVLALKHGDRLDLAPFLARLMLHAAPRLVAEADLIAPVPLHWTRRLTRRANQSAELTRHLCRLAGRPDANAPRLLRRRRRTASQGRLDREAREANIADAFTLAPGADLKGRRILLVDDVLTTGATLSACARLCRAAGAAGIDVLVSALAPEGRAAYLKGEAETEGPQP